MTREETVQVKSQKQTYADTVKSEEKIESLVYLEDIHIFALANLLKRTIIVVALDKIKDLQPNNIRGIYLPILNKPNECVKEPILIAFHNFHFCPLLYGNYDEKLNKIEKDVNYDTIFTNTTPNLFKFNEKYEKKFLYFPLIYHNFDAMKVHFLEPAEEKLVQDIFNNYLNIIEIPTKLEVGGDDIPFVCCKIGTNKILKNNGLSSFLEYIVEKTIDIDTEEIFEEDKRFQTSPFPLQKSQSDTRRTRYNPHEDQTFKCIVKDCPNQSVRENGGYCHRCFTIKKSEERSKSQTRYRCIYENCQRATADNSNYCETHNGYKRKKCLYPHCSVDGKPEFKGYCESCYNLLYKVKFELCKTENCNSYAISGCKSYCKECFQKRKCSVTDCNELASKSKFCDNCYSKYKNYLPPKCKIRGCPDNATIGEYCGDCYRSTQASYSKCKNLNCTKLASTSGYCTDCYRTNLTMFQKCKSINCIKFTNTAKNDGFCDTCHQENENKTLIINYIDKCSNCSEPALKNGYCSKCFQKIYNSNTCKNKTCLMEPKFDGYCLDCYLKNIDHLKCGTPSCRNIADQEGYCKECLNAKSKTEILYNCTGHGCENYIHERNSYCSECILKFEKEKKKTVIEIPIRHEPPPKLYYQTTPRSGSAVSPYHNNYSFTPTKVSYNQISAYNQTPEQVSYIRNQYNSKISCEICHSYIPTHLRKTNEKLCAKCMSQYYNRHGKHYNGSEYFV